MGNTKTLIEQKASCLCGSSDSYTYDAWTNVGAWNDTAQLEVKGGKSVQALYDEYIKYTSPDESKWKILCKFKHTLQKLYKDSGISYVDVSTQAKLKKQLKTWERKLCVNIDAYKVGKVLCTKEQLKALKCKTGEEKTKYQNKKGNCYCYTPKGKVTGVKKLTGFMDPKAHHLSDELPLGYHKKYNDPCGCCRYNVRLATISYDISFYKKNQFPDGEKVTMVKGRSSYSVCILEHEYKNLGHDKVFQGYQDDSVPSLNNIEKDRFVFKGDVGFYGSPDDVLIKEVNRAMTWYLAREGTKTTTVWDDCVPNKSLMNGITIEIIRREGRKGVNHGVIRFGGTKPTLRIDAPSLAMWLDYRATNTLSGIDKAPNDIKIHNFKGERFYDLTCDAWNNSNKYISRSGHECVKTNENGWITIRKNVVSESTIGLGTLLRRKEKPITGLGSLLED